MRAWVLGRTAGVGMMAVALLSCMPSCGRDQGPAPAAPAPVVDKAPVPSAADPDPVDLEQEAPDIHEAVEAVVASEEVLLALTPVVKSVLGKALTAGALPGQTAASIFAPPLTVTALGPVEGPRSVQPDLGVQTAHWSVARAPAVIAQPDLWRPLLALTASWEHGKFAPVKGHFLNDTRTDWSMKTKFYGLAHEADGTRLGITAQLEVTWRRDTEAPIFEADSWRIVEWHTRGLQTRRVPKPMFREVFAELAASPADIDRARQNLFHELVGQVLKDPDYDKPPYFRHDAWDRHPGLAVADVDGDRRDDVYVMPRMGRNALFRQRPDGRFEDIAAAVGLDIDGMTSSAVFADLDNDGDKDVVIGRTGARAQLLLNESGRFVDRSESHVDGDLPMLVSSVSAVDYDGDGLLDVYLSTYAAGLLEETLRHVEQGRIAPTDRIAGDFLPEADAKALFALTRREDFHVTFNKPGPPNVLLRNLGGGRFERVRGTRASVWRNTYQATWADYDQDGDADVYLANDYAPNTLLRNDGGKLVDVSADLGVADGGFGMGASFADYDLDGDIDLYVSNMFSKAGSRIVEGIGRLDPRFAMMAAGNTLLRNDGARFERVQGKDNARKAGWAWGGLFQDLDLDGYEDLVVASGYYSAPDDVAIAMDT